MKQKITINEVKDFRNTYKRFITSVTKGTIVQPVHMVNNGYLHTLNASFDGLFLREQRSDSLLNANLPMNFGTIQPCIRTEDKQAVKKSLLHLGLFEICGYSILGFDKMTHQEMAEKTIEEFFTFYTTYIKCDPQLLRIYYFGGGTLREISEGIIQNDEYINPDTFSKKIWKRLGVRDSQLVPEYSKETFLLHTGNPLREHHAGYRNDIFIKYKDLDFEIATLNFISHQTVIRNERIISIAPLKFYLREMAIGQERYLASITRTANLYMLPQIYPLLQSVLQIVKDEKGAMTFTDALRVIHYFFSDGWTYEILRGRKFKEHRHEINKFMDVIKGYRKDIQEEKLMELLQLNASLQPWHPKLISGIRITREEIEKYKNRKKG